MVSLVTSRATARVCSTTTDWLTVVSPPVTRRNDAVPRAMPRPTATASPKSSTESRSGHTGRRGALSATGRHGGFDLGERVAPDGVPRHERAFALRDHH